MASQAPCNTCGSSSSSGNMSGGYPRLGSAAEFKEYTNLLGSVDIVETSKAHIFKFDTPGLTKDDMKVQVTDGILTVCGERKRDCGLSMLERDADARQCHRSERSYGKFTRTFRLPENSDPSQIKASVVNGVLEIAVGKLQSALPRTVEVNVDGSGYGGGPGFGTGYGTGTGSFGPPPSYTSNVAVLGASGKVGSAVIQALSNKYPGMRIRAGVRDPASDKATRLAMLSPNVALVHADYNKANTMQELLRDVDVVFINVPGDQNRSTLANNAIDACKKIGTKHVVLLSVLTATQEKEVFGKQFSSIENHLKKTGLNWTILRLPLFIDNNWGNQDTIKTQGRIFGPVSPYMKFTPIAVQDVGEAVATIMASPLKHAGKVYSLTTRPYSNEELARAFSQATGRQIEYVQIPFDQAKKSFLDKGYPSWQVDGMLELYRNIEDKNPVTNQVSDDFKYITGHEPMTIEQWCMQNAAAFK